MGERLLDLGELDLAADQRRVEPSRAPDRSGHELDQPESIAVQRFQLGSAREQHARRRPHEHVAARCRRQRPLGEHDHAAAHIAVRADESETCLDARTEHRPDPGRRRELVAEYGKLLARLGRGPDRAERVVLVCCAGAEDSHCPAVREPMRDSAVPLNGGRDQRETARRDNCQKLRVTVVGVACAVDEGYGDRLAPIGVLGRGCGCEELRLWR